ncbi:hexokinase type 2-like [Littorina saxatilis]|uniref:hexokinase type 2-like n=1 Tax=Littorina saxatilis TaxID=31220 RepID=UPI0038B62199
MTTHSSRAEEIWRMLTLGGGLFLWVATGIFMNSHGTLITCEAGTYVLGQPASVTCNFRTDVNASKHSFNVARYTSYTQKGDIGNDILVCHWSEVSQKHDCIETEGYKFKNINQQYVTVGIPSVTDEHAGIYTCFFVPSQGKDTHACELFVRKTTFNDTTPIPHGGTPVPQGGEDNTPTTAVAVALSLILLVLIIFAVLYIYWRRHKDKNPEEGGEAVPLLPKDTKIQERLKGFELSTEDLKDLMNLLDQEMKKGLDESTKSQADVKMYSALCPMPVGSGAVDFVIVDFGSTCVKVSEVKLRSNVHVTSKTYLFDTVPDIKEATCEQIFHQIATAIDKFREATDMSAKTLKVVLIFHFPCNHTTINKASLAKWTKEFCCEGVVGQDLNELLQKNMQTRADLRLEVVAISNNVVNTLMTIVHQNRKCQIGLHIGHGFNACYVNERDEGTEDYESCEIYNTELGALGENGTLDHLRTKHDKDLDASSRQPGSQILEKMVSWTYLGKVVTLALEDLRKDELILHDVHSWCDLSKPPRLTADHVAEIDGDTSEDCNKTARILRGIGFINPTEEDLRTVKYICRLVADRAASLAAASLATLINRLHRPDIVVAVEGELCKKMPRFYEVMYNKTHELVRPEFKDKFSVVSSFSGGRIGTARMALAALQKQNTAAAGTR